MIKLECIGFNMLKKVYIEYLSHLTVWGSSWLAKIGASPWKQRLDEMDQKPRRFQSI